MKKLILLSALGFAALSCEKTIDYDLPQEDPRLVIDAYLFTGEPIKAFVSTSKTALAPGEPMFAMDATVLLYEEGQLVDTLEPIDSNDLIMGQPHFKSTYEPLAGKLYRLEAHKGEFPTAYGEDTPLEAVPLLKAEYDSLRATLEIEFKDPPGEGDYYRVAAYVRQSGTGYSEFPIYMSTFDPLVDYFYDFGDDFEGESGKSGRHAFLSDASFDGQIRSIRFEDVNFWNSPNNQDSLVIELSRVSFDFYRHEQSKGANYVNDDNPFAEPVQIYTNVKNGYGIVAAGSSSIRVID